MIAASYFTLGWADSFDAIRIAAGKIKSIEADFIQEKQMRILKKPLIAHGHFIYQSPDSLRWEYRQPMRSVLLMHEGGGQRFTFSDKGWGEDGGGEMKSMNLVFQEISNWLNGRFDENPLFNASLVPGNRVILTPKGSGMDQFVQRIEMILGEQPGVMKEVWIHEGPDSSTRFLFKDIQINLPVSEMLFRTVE